MTNSVPHHRWYRLTSDRLVLLLLAVEGLLWLSERFQWFPLNEHKGWTVLIVVASVGAFAAPDAAVVCRRPTLPLAIPIQHPVAAGADGRRCHPMQLDEGGD